MAKLKSLLKIEGTLDDLTFYKTKDGHMVRTKGGVSADRIANDPKFKRTRENGQEFAHAAAAGKLLRHAIRPLMKIASDGRVVSRLLKAMAQIKNLDTQSERGLRSVGIGIQSPEGMSILKGFDFNIEAPLASVLHANYEVDSKSAAILIPAFDPAADITQPGGATHVQFSGTVSLIDFTEKMVHVSSIARQMVGLNSPDSNVGLKLENVPTGNGQFLYFLCIEFFQELNGKMYPIQNGSMNALSIIAVL